MCPLGGEAQSACYLAWIYFVLAQCVMIFFFFIYLKHISKKGLPINNTMKDERLLSVTGFEFF